MSRVTQIVLRCVGVVFALALMATAVWWGYTSRPLAETCRAIEYDILDSKQREYVSETELNELLKNEGIYPVGNSVSILSLSRIETAMRHHPMVRTAECYLTQQNIVWVDITQRVPLLRVQKPGEYYIVDTDRRQMQARDQVKDSVLMVTGTVGIRAATTEIADFAQWLQGNRYWRERIERVHMRTPRMAVLYMRQPLPNGNKPAVVLGEMSDFENKLRKLRIYIENGEEAWAEKYYRELDLRFQGQVIGRE